MRMLPHHVCYKTEQETEKLLFDQIKAELLFLGPGTGLEWHSYAPKPNETHGRLLSGRGFRIWVATDATPSGEYDSGPTPEQCEKLVLHPDAVRIISRIEFGGYEIKLAYLDGEMTNHIHRLYHAVVNGQQHRMDEIRRAAWQRQIEANSPKPRKTWWQKLVHFLTNGPGFGESFPNGY